MTTGTLQEIVNGLSAFGDRRALGIRSGHGARWWSYRRLEGESVRFAALLEAEGVGPGDRVAIWGANSPEWAAAALGAFLRGAVVVPIDGDASPARARSIVELAQARLVLHAPDVDAAAVGVPPVPLFAEGAADFAPAPVSLVPVGPEDPAVLLFTSGSTHEPRGVVLTHRNLVSQAAAFGKWRRLTKLRAFRLLALSPLSHAQGLLMGLIVPVSLGLSVLYSESVEPAQVIRTIRQNRVNLLLAVPRVQTILADALRNTPQGRSGRTLTERAQAIRLFPLRRHVLFIATRRQLGYSFGVLLVGGAVLPSDDERFWYECGYVLVQGYGLTETSALVSIRTNGPFRARPGSVGQALPHQDVRIGDGGEVLVRGPNVSTLVAGGDGYLHTGDLGRLDASGRLWLRGRKDDVIVTGEGLNVHASDVEAVLHSVAGVRDALVADPHCRGQVHAVLLLANGTAPQKAVASANASLEPYQRVRSWSVWPAPDFPRTNLLKVRRAEIVDAVAREDAPPAPATAAEAVPDLGTIRAESDPRRRLEMLALYVARSEGRADDDRDAQIEDFGLSSLDAVELLSLLEEMHSRQVTHVSVNPSTSIAELRRSVGERAPATARSALPAQQPGWSAAVPGRALRHLTRPLLVGGWSHLAVEVSAELHEPPAGPCIFAVAPHRHWLDAFAVQAVLPRGSRTVTVTNRDFSEHFAPKENVSRRTRLSVGLAYHVLWPMLFEFVIVPNFGSTREGLQELGRAIDRGLSPISFPKGLAPPGKPNPRHEHGVALLATQTATPVVPVWLEGNDDLRVLPRRGRRRVEVRFGDVVSVGARTRPSDVVERVEAAYVVLAGNGGRGR